MKVLVDRKRIEVSILKEVEVFSGEHYHLYKNEDGYYIQATNDWEDVFVAQGVTTDEEALESFDEYIRELKEDYVSDDEEI